MDICPPWEAPEKDSRLADVVAGLISVHQFIRTRSRNYIIRHGDVKGWHRTVFHKVVPLFYYAGNYRCDDYRFPCLRVDVGVPPNPGAPFADVPGRMAVLSDEILTLISQTDEYLRSGASDVNSVRAVIHLAAVFMGRFVQIHPFRNGNGRMCRMIGNYVLQRYGYPALLWPAIVRPAGEYEPASEACMRGDYKPLFRYLLAALAAQSTA